MGRELEAFSPSKFLEGQATLNCRQESVDIEASENMGMGNFQVDLFRNRKASKTDLGFNSKSAGKSSQYRGFAYKTFVPAPVKVGLG